MMDGDHPALLVGVVEGFYGKPWTLSQRRELFALMKSWQMNCYLYAPKDDRKHRAGWRELYTGEELADLQNLVEEAQRNDVEFIYAISPGLDMVYSSSTEQTKLEAKLDQVADLGCSSFAVLFDDIEGAMTQADLDTFESLSHAHSTVANKLFRHLRPKRMLFCPTEYCASRAMPCVSESEYLRGLGQRLDQSIEIMWTGSCVIPRHILVEELQELREVIGRKPCIWDNVHANDFDRRRLFLGPYHGRSYQILEHVSGVLSNPNCEFTANFIPLHTLAAWTRLRSNYDPEEACRAALADWMPRFQSNSGAREAAITDFEIQLLIDLFYLPYDYGARAWEVVNDFIWLEDCSLKDPEWPARAAKFRQECRVLSQLHSKFQSLASKELFIDIHPYIWDVKELAKSMLDFIDAVESGSKHPKRPPMTALEPSVSQGGIAATLQALLANRKSLGSTYCVDGQTMYTVRPYEAEDKEAVYSICLHASLAVQDAKKMAKIAPNLIGDRWVGGYLRLPQCFAFVLTDSDGICGYAVAAVDTADFQIRFQTEYLPRLQSELQEVQGSLGETIVEQAQEELSYPKFCCLEDSDDLYPSHLYVCLLPRARNKGNGRRLVETVTRHLREAGSSGVHAAVNQRNKNAFEFFKHIGFAEFEPKGVLEHTKSIAYCGMPLVGQDPLA
eukprot:TRINITY_DN8262_c0_g1_i1.p1 TRINITY_DN8262_c0_g1~~TRINITY_DN8262_c0_g1_i1.p1  ORF type:complete len:673 (+),score=142.49 TRINITY_DN8262_c0_g1_i1:179-2197(+)